MGEHSRYLLTLATLLRATLAAQRGRMLHFVHVLLKPFEVLLELFCILTPFLLYPGDEGQIQSKFEDLWVRIDDYKQLALSKHAAFMTQVAEFETRFLDRVFGPKLISWHALSVSLCCAIAACAVVGALVFVNISDVVSLALSIALLFGSIAVCVTIVFVRKQTVVRGIAIGSLVAFILVWAGYTAPGPEQGGRLTWDVTFAALEALRAMRFSLPLPDGLFVGRGK